MEQCARNMDNGLIRPMSHEAVVVKKRSWMSSESCPDSESQQSNKDEQKY